jgi:multiple sugar transport system ATP-binding protein
MGLAPAARAAHNSGDVAMGRAIVREPKPEHLSVGGDGELTLEVALVEDLGSDSYIYGHLAGDADSHVIVRATRDHPRPGETVKVKVDTAYLHLFDAGTGRRVGE